MHSVSLQSKVTGYSSGIAGEVAAAVLLFLLVSGCSYAARERASWEYGYAVAPEKQTTEPSVSFDNILETF